MLSLKPLLGCGRLYAKRQSQNMTVLALMWPSMVPQQQPDNRLQTATDYGAMLREELGTLKGNLAEEQQLESEQHYAIFNTILTPSQVCAHEVQHGLHRNQAMAFTNV